ncbi:MAG TPA: hypothetical protein VLL52_23350 [Anaerolineae bacterium]|nr:hypothetical protein [Anaerolineae bacterium]
MGWQKPVKLVLTYDVKPDSPAYFQFVTGRYVPLMQSMGFEMKDAWMTGYGDYPNRLLEFVARDEQAVIDLEDNPAWASLNEHLQKYVTNFSYKFVPYREGFQF